MSDSHAHIVCWRIYYEKVVLLDWGMSHGCPQKYMKFVTASHVVAIHGTLKIAVKKLLHCTLYIYTRGIICCTLCAYIWLCVYPDNIRAFVLNCTSWFLSIAGILSSYRAQYELMSWANREYFFSHTILNQQYLSHEYLIAIGNFLNGNVLII